jgi:hypothetical protein
MKACGRYQSPISKSEIRDSCLSKMRFPSQIYGSVREIFFSHARSPSTSDSRSPHSGSLESAGLAEKNSSNSPVNKSFSSSLRSLRALCETNVFLKPALGGL